MAKLKAMTQGRCTVAYQRWLDTLNDDVVQTEFGYEPGEFTVYSSHWVELYELGLSPNEAFQHALDGYANARRDEEGRKIANYARIVAADQAAIARERAKS